MIINSLYDFFITSNSPVLMIGLILSILLLLTIFAFFNVVFGESLSSHFIMAFFLTVDISLGYFLLGKPKVTEIEYLQEQNLINECVVEGFKDASIKSRASLIQQIVVCQDTKEKEALDSEALDSEVIELLDSWGY